MKAILLGILLLLQSHIGFSQESPSKTDTAWKSIFRGSATKVNALVHTKLDVKFDFTKSYLLGKEWVTLKPYFYPTDSLLLDAKGMDIHEVSISDGKTRKPLIYQYDKQVLNIKLDKTYKGGEIYTIYIEYTAKPDEVKTQGSAAITNAKGLYFINPLGKDKNKPTQVWTQGETESNSVWMPTIDKPNQKSTEEIYMTVPDKYVTLSNGLLISQKKNTDGTRTDYWKMDLPHAPYLFFMGAGEFSVVKDKYKQKEVNYYVEKKYEPFARGIFGHTPEMIRFFSEKLGIDFPWPKYAQIVGRDFVSGAMENTTCTLHQESAYQNNRQLTDGNSWEETICHELFHQWFGDLVTTESWSNITVNESMANYSEVLWDEYKYGKDFADEHNYEDMNGYLLSGSESKDLVRYRYADKEDVFDAVSYNKGGRILHMLRNFVGDEAFYKSLNNYLAGNKFKTGEAAQLRLAFEEVTGKDLNWFWNQWYYGSGHPKLEINYNYDSIANRAFIYIKQTQETGKIFSLPVAIDIYSGNNKERKNIWIQSSSDTFSFPVGKRPYLINVDADKILLCEKKDNKSKGNFIYQLQHAPLYLDRLEALEYFDENAMPELALGLDDKYSGLRRLTIQHIMKLKNTADAATIEKIGKIAVKETDKKTKAAAIKFLAQLNDDKYASVFRTNINDSSYSVAAASLEGLSNLEPAKSYDYAKKFSSDSKGELSNVIMSILIKEGKEEDIDFITKAYDESVPGQEKLTMTSQFCKYLEKVSDENKLKSGIDAILKFRNIIPAQYRIYTDPLMKSGLLKLGKMKGNSIADYINEGFK